MWFVLCDDLVNSEEHIDDVLPRSCFIRLVNVRILDCVPHVSRQLVILIIKDKEVAHYIPFAKDAVIIQDEVIDQLNELYSDFPEQ